MFAQLRNTIKKHKYKILAAISFTAAGYFFYQYARGEWQVKLSSFLQALNMNEVDEVIFEGQTIFFRSNKSDWYRTYIGKFEVESIFYHLMSKGIVFSTRQTRLKEEIVQLSISTVVSCAIFKYFFNQLNSPSTNVNLKANIYDGGGLLQDFYGGDKIKEKLEQTIDFLHNPQTYEKMGARIRRGVLFYGPPGTGKTMLARALANQSGCAFIKATASEFIQILGGMGPRRVRELFQTARKAQKGCIIFIDQIDALGSRMNSLQNNHQTTSTINQFLSEMDGFSATERVIVVAATNRIDLVDHAILRSGRFDVKVHIPLPDASDRVGIFKKIMQRKLKDMNQVDEAMVNFIGEHSQGWCGADLQNLINQSIYIAIRENAQKVDGFHIQEAYEELAVRRR